MVGACVNDGQYPDGPRSGPRNRPLVTELVTALSVAATVATVVVLAGVDRGAAQNGGLGQPSAPGTPTTSLTSPATPTESTSPSPSTSAPTKAAAKVTKVDISADPTEYTGKCPKTVTVTASIFTDTGPVTVRYQWLDVDGNAGPEKKAQFGGPGPQKVKVSTTFDVDDDQTVFAKLQTIAPNEVTSEAVEVTVTCTPHARTWLDFDTICAVPHTIVYHGSITVPHGPMTVTYTWERSDGAIGPTYTLSFPAGGEQTLNVPDSEWQLWTSGEFSERIKILTPYESTSNWSTFTIC